MIFFSEMNPSLLNFDLIQREFSEEVGSETDLY